MKENEALKGLNWQAKTEILCVIASFPREVD
jgi:hypothetical protein